MTREEYIHFRTTSNFPRGIIFEYYLEHCSSCVDENTFEYITDKPHMIFNPYAGVPGIAHFNKQVALKKIISEYDKKFHITVFTGKKGEILKIY